MPAIGTPIARLITLAVLSVAVSLSACQIRPPAGEEAWTTETPVRRMPLPATEVAAPSPTTPEAGNMPETRLTLPEDEPRPVADPAESPTPSDGPPGPTGDTPAPPVPTPAPSAGQSRTRPRPVTTELPALEWPALKINLAEGWVDVEGVVGANRGWLEQIACSPGTRTHESVVIALARPSHIHAALLLLGLEAGHPGAWEAVEALPEVDGAPPAIRGEVDPAREREMDEADGHAPAELVPADAGRALVSYRRRPPAGPAVRLTVRYQQPGGAWSAEQPVGDWVRDNATGASLPDLPWVFAGSKFVTDFEGRRVYAADLTGSIAGLVTFGDEVLGWPEIIPDRVAVRPPEWLANTEAMPAPDTPLILRLRPVEGRAADATAP